jgi:DNA/RNA endonuclease YhcR with UshA esterase domain
MKRRDAETQKPVKTPARSHREVAEHERLRRRFEPISTISIADMPCRCHTQIAGEVKRMQTAPRSGVPALEVVLTDGTGVAVAIFTGRRSIPGIESGRSMIVEGVARDERGRRVLLNPAYTLLA